MLSRPLLDRVAFFGISWYAILITGAIVIGYLLASGEARRLHLPQDTVIDFLLYAIPLGLICARLYYVAFRFNDYSEDLRRAFNSSPLPWRFPSATYGIGTWRRSSMNFAGICSSLCC